MRKRRSRKTKTTISGSFLPKAVRHVVGSPSRLTPGHAFQPYFKGWELKKGKDGKAEMPSSPHSFKVDVQRACSEWMSRAAVPVELAEALDRREKWAFDHCSTGLEGKATNTTKFAAGLGTLHPMGTGFSFLDPYGVPYLAGHAIKGAARYTAEWMCERGEAGWTEDLVEFVFGRGESLLGDEEEAKEGIASDRPAQRGLVAFWDALPRRGNEETLKMECEIITASIRNVQVYLRVQDILNSARRCFYLLFG